LVLALDLVTITLVFRLYFGGIIPAWWPPSPAAAAASTPSRRSIVLRLLLGLALLPRRLLALLSREDCVDQLGTAQPPVSIDRQLGGKRVKVSERAGVKRGTVKHGHGSLLVAGIGGLRPRCGNGRRCSEMNLACSAGCDR